MKKNIGVKTALYPMPVFIIGTYDENGTPDAMNAAAESSPTSVVVNIEVKYYVEFRNSC